MRERRDEDGRIVREGYSTRDGYQDDPGKPDEEETVVHEQPDGRLQRFPTGTPGVVPVESREAFEGILRFVTVRGGTLSIEHLGAWKVTVAWHGAQEQRVHAIDNSFDEACVLCRGLLAHALASGVASL